MTSAAATQVGTYFLRKYCNLLQQNPDVVHQFYSEASTMVRVDDLAGTNTTVNNMMDIHSLILSLNFTQIEIKTTNFVNLWGDGLLVMVSGLLQTKEYRHQRKFVQMFFLAPQEKGYFVLNDYFHFVDQEQVQPALVMAQENNESNLASSTVAQEIVSEYIHEEESQAAQPITTEENDAVDNYNYSEPSQQVVSQPDNWDEEPLPEEPHSSFSNGMVMAPEEPVQPPPVPPPHVEEPVGEPVGDSKQLMGKVWDWNMDGTKLKKFDGCVLHTANDDGERGEDNAIAIQEEDRGDGFKDGRSNGSDDHDGHDDRGVALEDSNDENVELGTRAVQLLAIRANFQISAITAYDWCTARCIYRACEWEVQEEGMVDLLPTGPGRLVEAYGFFSLGVFTPDDIGSCIIPLIIDGWYVGDGEEVEEYTRTIYGGLGRKVEITYLVVPEAIETYVDVALNLKDLGSRSRAVYGSIKASTIDYGSKRVQLFIIDTVREAVWLHIRSSTECRFDCIAISSTFQAPH